MKDSLRYLFVCVLVVAYALLSVSEVSLLNSATDLGRHLRDGYLILHGQASPLWHTNYYSFAAGNTPFINHHWLTTVILYLVWDATGFEGLNLFYILLGAVAFWLVFRIAEREAGTVLAGTAAVILLPLLAVRKGLRPEVFSLLLYAVFFTVLWRYWRNEIGPRWIWLLPLAEALWVNLHPGFLLGPAMVGFFFAGALLEWWKGSPPTRIKPLLYVLVLTFAAGLCNPNGIRGLLFPLTFWRTYSFAVDENLPLLQIWRLPADTGAPLIALSMAALALSFLAVLLRRAKTEWPLLLLALSTIALSLRFFRAYPLLAVVTLPILCINLRACGLVDLVPRRLVAALIAVFALAGLTNDVRVRVTRWEEFSLGQPDVDRELAEFLSVTGITGRVLNNFVAGSYLIHYFPEQPIFIDSRPEAYPPSFMVEDFIQPIVNEDRWRAVQQKYQFDFICFVPSTTVEADFINRRSFDPEWALVYVAQRSGMVVVRRTPQFQHVISRYEVRRVP